MNPTFPLIEYVYEFQQTHNVEAEIVFVDASVWENGMTRMKTKGLVTLLQKPKRRRLVSSTSMIASGESIDDLGHITEDLEYSEQITKPKNIVNMKPRK